MSKRTEVNMTEGSIFPHIVKFAIPLLLGNLFQQLYNMVDTWVVGNFVGKDAFSAVGTINPIINTIIGFFVGFSNGAGVIISRHFGAGNNDKVKDTVHTFVSVTLILCLIFTAAGILLTPLFLRFVASPSEVAALQRQYLTIYFAGVSGLLLYNMGSAILRAIGNSTLPFIFLVVSAISNIILDLVFVIFFGMGVQGVAYATIIAQFASALLVFGILLRTKSVVKVSLKNLKIDTGLLKSIINVGLPAALQMCITSFSNIFVQSYINRFGSDCMGGWSAYVKVDQLIFLPMQSISLATQTFVGQNLGAELYPRTRKGVRTAQIAAVAATIALTLPVVVYAPAIVGFFITEGETKVIEYGTLFLRNLTPFYFLCGFNQVSAGALRGARKSRIPMVVMLCSFVFFRQLYLFVVANYISNTVLPIAMGYPAGWAVCSAVMMLAYRRNFTDAKLAGTKEKTAA